MKKVLTVSAFGILLAVALCSVLAATPYECLNNTHHEGECKDCCDCLDADAETRRGCRDECVTHDFSLNFDFITFDPLSILGPDGDYSVCTDAGDESACKTCCDGSEELACGDRRFCRDACVAGTDPGTDPPGYQGIEQTLSDQAQRTTIAFDGLAFLTGDLCSDSFLPPGKVSDFFGFQHLRDNDPDEMGHNTDFLTRISNNVLYILTDSQVQELIALAQSQIDMVNEYAYRRFPLMEAFRRLLEGDLPEGSEGLDRSAVMEYSAELYQLDGEISFQRAEVIGGILRALDPGQVDYLDSLVGQGMLSWPDLGEQVDPQSLDRDVHVAMMTYASQLYSWYAGSLEADTYFCPERQGTYFGSFYLKDMPAMGNPDYTIDSNLTADMGNGFLALLTDSQAELVRSLVDLQWPDLSELVERRTQIATELRRFITGPVVEAAVVLDLAARYGELDGEIVYYYATHFAAVGETLSDSQEAELMALRDLDEYPCSGAFLYSENVEMPEIANTDFLFGVPDRPDPRPDIRANHLNGPVVITPGDPLSVTVRLDAGTAAGSNADWWAAMYTASGWQYLDITGADWTWESGLSPTAQVPLFDFAPVEVFYSPDLPEGSYSFYFGVDMTANGLLDMDQIYYDHVGVTVTSGTTIPVN